MPFAVRHLYVLGYAGGNTLWFYRAADMPLVDVLAPDFFAPCSDMLAAGDFILVSAMDGGGHVFVASAGLNKRAVVELLAKTPNTVERAL